MSKRIPLGSKVRLKLTSKYNVSSSLEEGSDNPVGCIGVIDQYYDVGLLRYGVRWSNITHNSYKDEDLEIVELSLGETQKGWSRLVDEIPICQDGRRAVKKLVKYILSQVKEEKIC